MKVPRLTDFYGQALPSKPEIDRGVGSRFDVSSSAVTAAS
jgi:hypothetical protein